MEMGINKYTAYNVINSLDTRYLSNIIKIFGEEKDGKIIANAINKHRIKNSIKTSEELSQIIKSAKKNHNNFKKNPATKTFQAIRIFVNQELTELILGLIEATRILKKDGILIVVSFHSLEDKIVKYFFKSLSETKSVSRYMPKTKEKVNLFKLINKKPIVPLPEEIIVNPPSRSAKLRSAVKQEDSVNFDTDILEKFKNLIEIENYSNKL